MLRTMRTRKQKHAINAFKLIFFVGFVVVVVICISLLFSVVGVFARRRPQTKNNKMRIWYVPSGGKVFFYCYTHTSSNWIQNFKVRRSRNSLTPTAFNARDNMIFRKSWAFNDIVKCPAQSANPAQPSKFPIDAYAGVTRIYKQKRALIGEIGMLHSCLEMTKWNSSKFEHISTI